MQSHPVAISLALHTSEGSPERRKLSRDAVRTPFRHFPLFSTLGFFVGRFPLLPLQGSLPRSRASRLALSRRFTSSASTYFTGRNSKKAKRRKKRASSLPQSRGCSVVYNGVEKKWIIPHLSLATARCRVFTSAPFAVGLPSVSIVPRSYRRGRSTRRNLIFRFVNRLAR